MPDRSFFREQILENCELLFPGQSPRFITTCVHGGLRILIVAHNGHILLELPHLGTSPDDFSKFLGHTEVMILDRELEKMRRTPFVAKETAEEKKDRVFQHLKSVNDSYENCVMLQMAQISEQSKTVEEQSMRIKEQAEKMQEMSVRIEEQVMRMEDLRMLVAGQKELIGDLRMRITDQVVGQMKTMSLDGWVSGIETPSEMTGDYP